VALSGNSLCRFEDHVFYCVECLAVVASQFAVYDNFFGYNIRSRAAGYDADISCCIFIDPAIGHLRYDLGRNPDCAYALSGSIPA